MNERIFLNAVDAQGAPLHIVVRQGRIAALAHERPACAGIETVDLGGQLVLPGLVDGHIHLDKSFVGGRWHPHQPAASLRERLALEKRELAAAAPILERADALLRLAAGWGTMAMRSHVDVDATTQLTHLHAVMRACERWRDLIDVELVAFPQAGVMSCPGTVQWLEAAVREGAQVVGGIDPGALDGDPDGQLDAVFGIADRHGAKIDIHLHEPGEQCAEQLTRIATRTRALGMAGRVAVSHAYGLGDLDEAALARMAARLSEAGVAIMTNAPGQRAFPPVLALREAGVLVFTGNDNIQDAWWPYGNGDMLQRAMLVGYRSGFYTDEELNVALEMATVCAARVLGLAGYGLQVGHRADFMAVPAACAAAAVAGVPAARTLVRAGRVWHPLRDAPAPVGQEHRR
ncbi:cytosine deaminase [Bordetella trematum]|uniref:Cytosine deaminase n=1 Tax=Bordetella trematum TaxID=123899 RepID=A0A157SFY5_9BORD|nr:amidohydrolase family protein [Bordetella trematum]AUL45991.1 cytosine deaminase [Bordetella trematum]AZR92746.1 cytosine deaminase [Bordetella trematum]NNH18049.1 amidohydrolase family protein [Bordetella trematum]QIM71352.1 metal-dependent hydrolase [Bordetella trematum]SAI30139.1 cytosine deaminase [Bordetella trematum]